MSEEVAWWRICSIGIWKMTKGAMRRWRHACDLDGSKISWGNNIWWGEGRFLRQLIARDHVPSMILWGPPGTGKTTLAAIIAKSTRSRFVFYSAVLGSVKEIRVIIERAREEKKFYRRRSILFVDEIHRFNKGAAGRLSATC